MLIFSSSFFLLKLVSQLERERDHLKRELDTLRRETPLLVEKAVQKELKALNAQTLSTSISTSVNKSLTDALAKSIPSSVDKAVKESVTKYISQEKIADTVTRSVAASLQPIVIEAFRVVFEKVVIPGFEKSAQTLFAQLHATFQTGINQGEHREREKTLTHLQLTILRILGVTSLRSTCARGER